MPRSLAPVIAAGALIVAAGLAFWLVSDGRVFNTGAGVHETSVDPGHPATMATRSPDATPVPMTVSSFAVRSAPIFPVGPIVAWVRTPDGDPVSGATVRARLRYSSAELPDPAISGELTSGTDGRVSWNPTAPSIPLHCEFGGADPDHVMDSVRVPVVPGVVTPPVIISAAPAIWKRAFHVTDTEGRPLAGALVAHEGHAAMTGADGRATIPGRGAQPTEVLVSKAGFATSRHEIGPDVPADAEPIRAMLPTAVTNPVPDASDGTGTSRHGMLLEGLVLRVDGSPFPGAWIGLGDPRDWASAPDAITDAGGKFSVRLPSGRRTRLTIRISGHREFQHGVDDSGPPLREFRLPIGPAITGSIRNSSGSAIPAALITVIVKTDDHPAAPSAVSRDDGRFFIETLQPGPVDLKVSAMGFLPEFLEAVMPGREDLNVRLLPAARIAGDVQVEGSGARIPEFSVLLAPESSPVPSGQWAESSARWSFPGKTFRNADGSFSTDGLPLRSGRAFRLEVRAPGFETAVIPGVVADARESGVRQRIALRPGAAVSGIVLRGDSGAPVENACAAPSSSFAKGNHDPAGASGRTGRNGAFRIDGLPRKPVIIEARKDGFTSARSVPVLLTSQEPLDIGRLLMYPAGSAVVVIETPRAALGDTRAVASSPPGTLPPFEEEARIGEDRTVRFDSLRAGKVQIALRSTNAALDGLGSVIDVVAGQQATVIFEPPGRSQVAGRVAADGAFPEGATIVLKLFPDGAAPGAEPIAEAPAEGDGDFVFRGIDPGRYRLEAVVTREGQRLGGSVSVELAPGENSVTVRVTLKP